MNQHLNRRCFLKTLAGSAAGLAGASIWSTRAWAQQQRGRKPNIVLIYTDDLGYGDIGCYGADRIATPHIDRMAEQGMRFTDYYSPAAVCTPARAALLTGSYAYRTGTHWVLFPDSEAGLDQGEVTVAELLRDQGYATALYGKWHLGDQRQHLPLQHGFDEFYGLPGSNNFTPTYAKRFGPLPVIEGNEVVATEPDQSQFTREYTQRTIDFIRRKKDQPFFVLLSHPMPHVPLAASDQFKGTSQAGLYGDAVQELDWSVGEVLREIDAQGLAEDTLVIFTSDNGPWTEQKEKGGSTGPLRGGKFWTLEGGFRVPFVARWTGRIPAGYVNREVATGLDFLPTAAALSGATVPTDRTIDGHDMTSLLTDPAATSPTQAFYYTVGDEVDAVRVGKWKYRHLQRKRRKVDPDPTPPELYDLSTDIGENRNLIGEHPQIAQQLAEQMARFQDDLRKDSRLAGTRVRQ